MMNKNMENSYLIQRLKKPIDYNNPWVFGGGLKNGGVDEKAMKQIDAIFSFDYMGAAEFEFGALPETLNKMIENSSDFIRGSMTVHWRAFRWRTRENIKGNSKVYFLCHKEHKKEVKRRIASWATGNNISGYPKCGVRLNESFDEHDFCGWLELDNGFFFFIDEKMFKNTCKLFGVK